MRINIVLQSLLLFAALALGSPTGPSNLKAAIWYSSPEVPNITCADGVDNDADGTWDTGGNADTDCSKATPFSANGNGYRANVKDGIFAGYTTDTDATSFSGTYVKKTSSSASFFTGELALHGSFTNATYFAWIRYRCSETQCPIWLSTSPIKGDMNNATQAFILPQQAGFGFVQVLLTGSDANFKNGQNGGGARTFALNGNGAIFIKGASGLEIDCFDLDPDAGHAPDCPTGGGAETFDYEVFDVASAPTAEADFDNANALQFVGFSDTVDYTISKARILWDKDETPQRGYIFIVVTDTDDELGTATADDDADWFGNSAVRGDSIDFRLRADLAQALDADTKNISCNVNDLTADGDFTGGSRTLTPDYTASSSGTVVASTSWSILCSFDLPTITADDIGLAQLFITDRDAATATSQFLFGTDANAYQDLAQWGRFKWSSTSVPGSSDTTAPTVGNPDCNNNVTTTSFTCTFTTNEAGQPSLIYGTSTGSYPNTFTGGSCSGSSCSVVLTGLTAGTTYFVKSRVQDAAGNVGVSSAEDSQATAAGTTANRVASRDGTGTTCSSGSPCSVATLISQLQPGEIGELKASVNAYTGSASMITISSKNGTASNKITIRCETDGGCLIDGQGARTPISLTNADHHIIEGFNAKNSGGASVVLLSTGADNNIIRRVCAWDTPLADNTNVFGVHGNTGNLLEDVCGFGIARKIFSNSQGGNNLTIRRAFGVWADTDRTDTKQVFTIAYNSFNGLCENCIATWDQTSTPSGEARGLFAADHMTGTSNKCSNAKYLGGIGYQLSAQSGTFTAAFRWPSGIECIEYDNMVAYIQKSTIRTAVLTNCGSPCGGSGQNMFVRNTTEVGGQEPDSIGSDWTATNRSNVATIAAMNSAGSNPFQASAGTGARVCFRYENGTLTSTPLWPWPMNQRIIDAMTAGGYTAIDLTAQMESIFGTIPAECGG